MAELTCVETRLGEVTGLAMAAQAATKKVSALAEKDKNADLVARLLHMHDEAAESEQRCTELAGTLEDKKTASLEEARSTKASDAEMMKTYLDSETDSLDGFEFLTMAEAGEVGHWSVLGAMGSTGDHPGVVRLVDWAPPIQTRLAADGDPDEPA
jgi:hypothetical protein